jgi:hypothetical protein
MALTFTTTTPSGASVAAVAALIQSAWRDALTGHSSGAWTLVEEFDSTSATIHYVVLKNSTSVSGVGADFYVVLARRASDGEMRICVGEGYTTSGHVLSTYAARGAGSPLALNANGTYTTTSFSLGTTLPGIGGTASDPNSGYTGSFPPGASTVKCTTYVTEKMAILSHYLASGTNMTMCFAIGNFADTLIVPPSHDEPIIGCVDLINTSGTVTGALTRHAIEAADSTMKYAQQIWTPAIANFVNCAMNQLAVRCGNYFAGDRYQSGRVAACEVAVVMYSPFAATNSSLASQAGSLRGKFRGLRYAAFDAVGVPGDTVVVDGHKHMLITKSTSIGGTIAGPISGPPMALVLDTGA